MAATAWEIWRTAKLSRLRCSADGKAVGRDVEVDCSGHSSAAGLVVGSICVALRGRCCRTWVDGFAEVARDVGRGLLVGSGKEVSARGAEEEADEYHVL